MHVDDITKMAKEFVLKDGKHGPTLFVETDAPQMLLLGMAEMPPTPAQRLSYFIAIGRKFGQEHAGTTIRELLYVMLAWASLQKVGDPAPRGRPSQDPNRKEMLVITHATITGTKVTYTTQMMEVIRANKKSVDLMQLPAPTQEGSNPQLALFITAFHHPQLTDAEIMRLSRDAQGPA